MMKTKRLFILAMVGKLAIAASTLAAQVNFTPELTLSEEYTDNLFLDFDSDTKVDDFITTAGLSLTLDVLGQTTGIELNYTPSYNKFADNDERDNWRHSASLRTWNDFSRSTRLQLSSTFLETEDPRDRSDEIVVDGVVTPPAIDTDPTRRDRNRIARNTNELRLSHQYGYRSSVYGSVSYSFAQEVNPLAGALVEDYQEVRPGFGLEYWRDQSWGVGISSYYANRDYEDRDDRKEIFGAARILKSFGRQLSGYAQYQHTYIDFDEEITDEDYQVYSPSVGIEYQFRENTNLSIGLGYIFQDFKTSEDDIGPFIESDLSNTWNLRRGYVRLIASSGYGVQDSGAEDLGLQIFYLGRIEARHNFTPRFYGDGYLSYRSYDYPNEDPERNDRGVRVGGGINYQALRWMILSLAVNHDQVSSNIETAEYTENSVLFTIRMSPENPYRLN